MKQWLLRIVWCCLMGSGSVYADIIHENLSVMTYSGSMPDTLEAACTVNGHDYSGPLATCITIENTGSDDLSLFLRSVFWYNLPAHSWTQLYSDWEYDLALEVKSTDLSTTLFNPNGDTLFKANQTCLLQEDCHATSWSA